MPRGRLVDDENDSMARKKRLAKYNAQLDKQRREKNYTLPRKTVKGFGGVEIEAPMPKGYKPISFAETMKPVEVPEAARAYKSGALSRDLEPLVPDAVRNHYQGLEVRGAEADEREELAKIWDEGAAIQMDDWKESQQSVADEKSAVERELAEYNRKLKQKRDNQYRTDLGEFALADANEERIQRFRDEDERLNEESEQDISRGVLGERALQDAQDSYVGDYLNKEDAAANRRSAGKEADILHRKDYLAAPPKVSRKPTPEFDNPHDEALFNDEEDERLRREYARQMELENEGILWENKLEEGRAKLAAQGRLKGSEWEDTEEYVPPRRKPRRGR